MVCCVLETSRDIKVKRGGWGRGLRKDIKTNRCKGITACCLPATFICPTTQC